MSVPQFPNDSQAAPLGSATVPPAHEATARNLPPLTPPANEDAALRLPPAEGWDPEAPAPTVPFDPLASALIDHVLALSHRHEVLLHHLLHIGDELSAMKRLLEEELVP